MSNEFSFPGTAAAYLSPPPNPFGRISEIAKRVGVAPYDGMAGMVMLGDDGNSYDVFEVVLAVLDHIDRACARGAAAPSTETERT